MPGGGDAHGAAGEVAPSVGIRRWRAGSPVAVNGRSLPSEDEQQPMQRFSRWLQKSFNGMGERISERVGEQVGGS